MSSLDELKLKILSVSKLEDLVAEATSVKRQSGRLWALCPFHEEKTGSLTIFEGRRYYCFGCKATGDSIAFVRNTKGLGFKESLRYLADRYSIDASALDQSQNSNDYQNRSKTYFAAMQIAAKHYQDNLRSPDSESARKYLASRGLSAVIQEKFCFGLAKDSFEDLSRRLRQHHISSDIAESLSLVRKRNDSNSGFYDFFRSRVMIPICDASGRTIAFGGRDLTNKGPKYLNSSETPIYHKRKSLFALHLAQAEMRKKKRALVVEGYMDAIQLHQAGFEETVACLGTALTIDQIKLLSPHVQQIYIIFDGDAAGRRAALSTLDSALEFPQIQFRSVVLPPDQDPDSLVKQGGAVVLQELIEKAAPLFDMALKSQLQSVEEAGVPGLLKTGVLQWIDKIQDPLRKGFLLAKTAEFTALPLSLLEQALQNGRESTASRENTQVQQEKLIPRKKLSKLEYELLAHLYFSNPLNFDFATVEPMLVTQFQDNPGWDGIIQDCLKILKGGKKPADMALSAIASTQDPVVLHQLEEFTCKELAFTLEPGKNPFEALAASIKRKEIAANIEMLKRALGQSFQDENETQVLREIVELTNKIRDIDENMQNFGSQS